MITKKYTTGNIIEWRDEEDRYHRLDGPALIKDLDSAWFQWGRLHRVDGPAVKQNSGRLEWFNYGIRHRLNGPAIDSKDLRLWYIRGATFYKEKDFINALSKDNISNSLYIDYKDKEGKLHAIDHPAIIWSDKREEWWRDGVPHREIGPAIDKSNGEKEWWLNGVRHRVDGPAIYNPLCGIKSWYIHGTKYSCEQKWFEALDKEDQINYLFKQDKSYVNKK